MKFIRVEKTFICQFNKLPNKQMLEAYKERRDSSIEELVRYYKDVVRVLRGTPAWGVSGVNKMLNELTASVRATLNNEKRGKTSAYAHAGKLLWYIKAFGYKEAYPTYRGRYELSPIISDEELRQFKIAV